MSRRLACAAVLLLASAAQSWAGIITWQYSSTLTASDGTDTFTAGSPDLHTLVLATVGGGNPLTPTSGNQSFGLGGITGSWMVTPDQWWYAEQFKATIHITDGASGLPGTLTFFGDATSSFNTDLPLEGPRTDFSYTIQPSFTKHDDFLDLGHHRFDVHVGDDFDATVTVSELPNAPEPATLVLAGVGVAGALLARRLRFALASPSRRARNASTEVTSRVPTRLNTSFGPG